MPAVFLDRDGVLTIENGRITLPKEVKIYDYVDKCIARIHSKGYLCIVITNQSGVARGLFTEEELLDFHNRLKEITGVDAIYYCPHYMEGIVSKYSIRCRCRKPEIGLISQACMDYDIDMNKSWMVGDRIVDVKTGINAGVRTALLTHGSVLEVGMEKYRECLVFDNLIEFTDSIIIQV